MVKKALLLVNPNSRSGDEDSIDQCHKKLSSAGFDVNLVESESPEHAIETIRKQCDEIDLVIVAGGDGTISQLAETIHTEAVDMAILPLGTANDLARSLNINQDPVAACDDILHGKRKRIDLGTVNEHIFFNVAHIGLGVEITHELDPELKKKWGVLSYLHAFIRCLRKKDTFKVEMTIDGKKLKMRAMHIAVGNGRFYGGGNVIDQTCYIDDGRLSVYILKPQSIWQLLGTMPFLRTGTQKFTQNTFTCRCESIALKTKKSMQVHADGESVTSTPARFGLIRSAISVYCPAEVPETAEAENGISNVIEDWLGNKECSCIQELLLAAEESANAFGNSIQDVQDKSLQQRFQRYQSIRRAIHKRIQHYLQSQGEQLVIADPETESALHLIEKISLQFTDDTDRKIAATRLHEEEKIQVLIQDAMQYEYDDNFLKILNQFADSNQTIRHELKSTSQ